MAWSANFKSSVMTTDANFEGFLNPGSSAVEVITLNPRELLDFNVTIASLVGETDHLEVQVLAGQRIANGNGIVTAASGTSITLNAADDPGTDDYYIGSYFLMTSGGEIGDLRQIIDFATATDIITLDRALSGTPSAAETYSIFHMRPVSQFIITAKTSPTEDLPQNGGFTVAGYPFVIIRARATGATNAHKALMTYQKDGVSV